MQHRRGLIHSPQAAWPIFDLVGDLTEVARQNIAEAVEI